MNNEVILVDEQDNPVGTEEKLAAHQKGLLHRAFSVFVFNSKGELLLQKRNKNKYHSGGLWTNTCCSHQSPGEETLAAAHRRLKEEMGFDCEMKVAGHLLYKTHFENGLTEHEYDYVLIGSYDGPVDAVNPEEAENWRWTAPQEVIADMQKNPENYSYWFKLALEDTLTKR